MNAPCHPGGQADALAREACAVGPQRRHVLQAGMAGMAGTGWVLPGSAAKAGQAGQASSAVAATGTPGIERPPLPGPPRAVQVPPISEQLLPNGVRVLTVPRMGTPLVTAALHIGAGRASDAPGQAGLAAMTANLLSKGATRGEGAGRAVDATTLARQAEALGSGLDTSSGWRTSSVQMTVTTPKLDATLALLADVMRRPLLQAEELERLRAQTLDSLKVTLANPGDVAGLAARRIFWGDSVHGGSATPASLQRLKLQDVQALHQNLYRPSRAVLVLAGDISAEQALQLAQQHLGTWTEPATAAGAPAAAPPRTSAARQTLVSMPGSGQSGVVLVAPFAALGDPDRRVAEVASALLAGGYSSRLNQEIRIKRGLSYGAGGGGESHPAGGMFVASAQTQHSTAREVAQVMREEILRVGREEASLAELDARKANLIGSFARQLETTAGLAGQVASQYFQGRPLADLVRFVDDVQAVTPAQVRALAARLWTADALRVVLAGDVPPLAEDAQVAIAALDLEQLSLRKP